MRIYETVLKGIKKSGGMADTYFVSKYGFSPYRGCAHGCLYCDGRAERYYLEGEFGVDVEVRTNAPELLDETLIKAREHGIVGISSGVSDAYQAAEEKYELMPYILDQLIKHKSPAYVMTKSALALRDIKQWASLDKAAGATLFVSLTTLDDEIARVFEPGASLPSERLEMIHRFKALGIGVVVLAMPLMPGITDGAQNVESLLDGMKTAGVDAVMAGGMTLRPGRQKEVFMDGVRVYAPHMMDAYRKLYQSDRPSGVPDKAYMGKTARQWSRMLWTRQIPDMVPHKLYKGRLQIYDEVYVLLSHMIPLYEGHHVNTSALRTSLKAYRNWLQGEKTVLGRSRNLTGADLDARLTFMLQTGELKSILQNDKLTAFLGDVIIDRPTFDYGTLKLK